MKKWLILALLLISTPLAADTRSEITAALDYFAQVWNENDIEAIQGYYHPDFVLLIDSGPLSRDDQMDRIRTLINDGGDRGKLETSDVQVKELGDSHAMAWGYQVLKFKDGSSLGSWFSTVYVNTPFGWKAILTRS